MNHLSPDLGTRECCHRALAALLSVYRLRGAAALLRDGALVRVGSIDLGAVAEVWPKGAAADALPEAPAGEYDAHDLPVELGIALLESELHSVVPLVSPRKRWGDLFLSVDRLASSFTEEDSQTARAFVAQLARLLDAAEILAHAVAVERSLRHAEKLAVIGETAARIAHEIRNPVTAAKSLTQQLHRAELAPADTEAAALVLGELERVERRISSLLRFARWEEPVLEDVDLGELARATLESFRPRLGAAGIELELELEQSVVVRADREKIRQVVVNLLENALDAMIEHRGGGRLELAVRANDGTGCLRLRDDGPGIPPEALPRIFEPFFTSKAGGTGLGLAIAGRIVEGLGGHINARAADGGGAEFAVELPVARRAEGRRDGRAGGGDPAT
jgi:signal transduction histidine kinase